MQPPWGGSRARLWRRKLLPFVVDNRIHVVPPLIVTPEQIQTRARHLRRSAHCRRLLDWGHGDQQKSSRCRGERPCPSGGRDARAHARGGDSRKIWRGHGHCGARVTDDAGASTGGTPRGRFGHRRGLGARQLPSACGVWIPSASTSGSISRSFSRILLAIPIRTRWWMTPSILRTSFGMRWFLNFPSNLCALRTATD